MIERLPADSRFSFAPVASNPSPILFAPVASDAHPILFSLVAAHLRSINVY
ncbi:hypothetical protein W822_20705 [Advenella kashmirensis W13003]|uniref:Uncharacterized protein n=1 Tax=Advenella kashmirensis W13003 TaxID=1424334 RepID=V8QNQ1_9BURK|nr:hypothetical protein W822_20705 [Advenella kashmirensis W13003]